MFENPIYLKALICVRIHRNLLQNIERQLKAKEFYGVGAFWIALESLSLSLRIGVSIMPKLCMTEEAMPCVLVLPVTPVLGELIHLP